MRAEVSFVKLHSSDCHWTSNNDKSTWVQVMAWCHQATSHYLSQCWPVLSHHMVLLGNNGLTYQNKNGSHFEVNILQLHFLKMKSWYCNLTFMGTSHSLVITWANGGPDTWCHMASLCHNELTSNMPRYLVRPCFSVWIMLSDQWVKMHSKS